MHICSCLVSCLFRLNQVRLMQNSMWGEGAKQRAVKRPVSNNLEETQSSEPEGTPVVVAGDNVNECASWKRVWGRQLQVMQLIAQLLPVWHE
jgi:hypothetical protein